MVARVGSDQAGKQLLSQFQTSHVHTSLIQEVPNTPSGTCLILLDENRDNAITLAQSANSVGWNDPFTLSQECIEYINKARIVLLSSEIPERVTLAFAQYARLKNKIVMLDAGGRNTKIETDLLSNLTILTLNQVEFRLNVEAPVSQDTSIQDLVSLARGLVEKLEHLDILLKIGARGSLYITHSSYYYEPAVECKRPILDTTGAGDAHAGGFTFALLQQKQINLRDEGTLRRCLRSGNICGYLSCTKLTSMASMPYLSEYQGFLKSEKQ